MYYFSKANTLLGMHSNKAIVVIMAIIYCFIAKLPQDYNLKMICYYSQQFEYSFQSTYWNSAAIVMYSKMELKEEILWCRRGWCGRSDLLQEQVGSLQVLLLPPSLLSIFSDPVTPSYNARSRAADSVCDLGLLIFWNSETSVSFQSAVFHHGSRMQAKI